MESSRLTKIEGLEADEFVSLAQLHFEHDVAIGALATAIEEKGVWSWDRFGRFVLSPLSSPEAQGALNRLALQQQYIEGAREPEEPFLDPSDDLLWHHGWRARDLPDFTGIAQKQSAPSRTSSRRPSDIARVENGLHMQIGALLEFALGHGRWKDCPRFSSQAQLIEAFDEHYKGMPAMSDRQLETSFAKARKALTQT